MKHPYIEDDGSNPLGWIAQEYGRCRYGVNYYRKGIVVLCSTPRAKVEFLDVLHRRWGWTCHEWPNRVVTWEEFAFELYGIARYQRSQEKIEVSNEVPGFMGYESGPWLERLLDALPLDSLQVEGETVGQVLIGHLGAMYQWAFTPEPWSHPLTDLLAAAGLEQIRPTFLL